MTTRRTFDDLRDLDAICSVRRMDLDMQVARAQAHVRDLEARQDDARTALDDNQARWRRAVSGQSLDLAAAAVWSVEVLRAETRAATLAADIGMALARRRQLGQVLASAAARCDAVDTLRVAARRRRQKWRDEKQMEDCRGPAVSGWRSSCE